MINTLEVGRFLFIKQGSSDSYETNGILTKIGYNEKGTQSSYAKVDINFKDRNVYNGDRQIVISNGSQWVFDFFFRIVNMLINAYYYNYYIW